MGTRRYFLPLLPLPPSSLLSPFFLLTLQGNLLSDSIIDFLHDVSTMKVSMNGIDVIGYKAIYLLEVVIGNSMQMSPETSAGKLLFGEVMQQFVKGNADDPNDLEWDLIGKGGGREEEEGGGGRRRKREEGGRRRKEGGRRRREEMAGKLLFGEVMQ
jgi:hypothetical protein